MSPEETRPEAFVEESRQSENVGDANANPKQESGTTVTGFGTIGIGSVRRRGTSVAATFKKVFVRTLATILAAGIIALVAILLDRGCIEDDEELVWESTSYTTSQ